MLDIIFVVLIIIAGIGLLIGLLAILSRYYYHRSLMATIVEYYLNITNREHSEKKVLNDIKKMPFKNDVRYSIPKRVNVNVPIDERFFENIQYYCLNEKSDKIAILYLHGAGYVRQPRIHHWKFINKLADETNVTLIFPIYPKAPNHCCEEVYESMTMFYEFLLQKYQKIILMGDSSGGGLALGLCQYFKEKKIKLPLEMILSSPWVDVSLNNPEIDKYQKKDPFISAANERIWGKCWARDLDVNHWKVSPINGDLAGLCPITLFAGTREILYPDTVLLYEKIKENNGQATFYEGKGLNHVYPIFPIPEAAKARKIMVSRIDEIVEENQEMDVVNEEGLQNSYAYKAI